jgi:hypothetical protein
MAPQAAKCFDGKSTFTELHDYVQAIAGNSTRFNKSLDIVKGTEKNFAGVLLWLFYKLGLCCGIVGEFAMYLAGKDTCPRINKCKLVVLGFCIATRMTQRHVMIEPARIGDVILGVPHAILAWLVLLRVLPH